MTVIYDLLLFKWIKIFSIYLFHFLSNAQIHIKIFKLSFFIKSWSNLNIFINIKKKILT